MGVVCRCELALLLLAIVCPFFSECAKILIFPGLGEATHSLVSRMVGEKLVDRGHNVTMVTSSIFLNSSWHASPSDRIPFITYDSIYDREFILGSIEEFITKSVRGEMSTNVYFAQLNRSVEFFSSEMESVLGNYEVMRQLTDENFDLALFDPFALFPLMVLERLGIPYIPCSTGFMSPSLARLLGLPSNPSYVPEGMTALSHQMSFMERLQNSLSAAGFIVFKTLFVNGFDEKRELWNINPDKSTADALTKSRMYIANSDFVLDYPRPYLPHSVMLGSSLRRPPSQIPPGELLDFLNSADDTGVVLVSLGSFMTSMDEDKIQVLADTISRLPYKVLWRTLPELKPTTVANNTLVMSWIPQNDVLGHPNIVALVSNGGGHGAYEATYHAVPVVSIPFFTDHPDIAKRLATRGLGLVVNIQTWTSDVLFSAIERVVREPSFKKSAIRWSGILKDYPQGGMDYGAFWIEHVIKHDSELTRAKGQNMSGFQYYLIDVFLFLFAALHAVEFLAVYIILNISYSLSKKVLV